MRQLGEMFAVVIIEDNKEKLCTTYNPTHEVWQPAIFETEEGATLYYDAVKAVKGFERNEYRILQVGIIK
jgi:hypothetical protein